MPAAALLLLPALLTALAYGLAGWLAVMLAVPPSYAAPIYPAAGIALAATLVYGRRVLPGVALGAFFVNAMLAAPRGQIDWVVLWLVPAVTGLGAAAQAALGARLVGGRAGTDWTLSEPRAIVGFCLRSALLACLLNATLSTTALSLAGVVSAEHRALTWWTWWAGDALGVIIGAPIVLTLIGRPRADWAPRRRTVGLPLLAATVLLAVATVQVLRWDEQRRQGIFERDALAAAAAVDSRLRESLYALQALQVRFADDEDVTAQELRHAAEPWLRLPIDLQAMGYIVPVARAEVAALEARASAVDGRPFRVFDRQESAGGSIAAADAELLAIRHIEPLDRNAAARGVNVLSIPASRRAVSAASPSGQPMATAGFRLTQERGDQTGVVVYQGLYRPTSGAAGPRRLHGMVFATLRMDQSIAAVLAPLPRYLDWCLVDLDPQAPRPRLAGIVGCERAPQAALHLDRPLEFAGRHWLLRLSARSPSVPEVGHGNAWLFSTVGMLAVGLLAAALLTMTGHTRQVETAVAERTADLEREVAERQRTEGALRESEQRLRSIFDHAAIGILYTDLGGQIRDANPRLRDMLGYQADELPGKTLVDITHPDDRAEDSHQLARLLLGEDVLARRRKRLLHHQGQTLWVQMVISLLRDAQGRPQRLLAVVEDITEHLRLQDAERARERAESANLAKSEFLSRMSHELRTPLNAMLGFAQLLDLDRQPALAPHQAEWMAQIQHAGWHLLEMINDTLDLSRIESGTLRLETAAVPLEPLLQQCVAMVEPSAARRGITVRLHPMAMPLIASADPTRLKQVLTNLLSNAVKYNVTEGRVDIETGRRDDGQLEIAVIDTGLGLSAAQQAELFQPFNRLGREQSGIEGTGIGLVIARRLAELMGGTLTVESQAGSGSRFALRLPPAGAADVVAGDGEDGLPVAPPYRHRRVHYVEDNETNAEVMQGILAQRPQVDLEVSALGLDGLAAIRESPPDLVLLDMHLPDIDGLELLRHLQRDPATFDIPVVVVSADATAARINEALAAGASHYLTKPLNVAGFLKLLDRLLESMDTHFGALD